MAFDIDRLMTVWTEELPSSEAAAVERFRAVYTDPVSINGSSLALSQLVDRARTTQAMLEGRTSEILQLFQTGNEVAVAFRLRGRHVGPMRTAAGVVPATGEHLDIRVIDLLTLQDGRISSIWMVADELGALAAIQAVAVSKAGSGASGS